MRVAILGCGVMGKTHALSYARMQGVEVVGVCDLQSEVAQKLAEQTGAASFSSFSAMLAGVDFDLVSITLPSHLHKAFTVQAAEAGKHVICEKPIALTLEDAEMMIGSCERNGVHLLVGHVVRFFPEYVQMKHVVEQGKLGRLGVAHAKRAGGNPGLKRAWFLELDKSGGVIIDLMIHDIDFLRWSIGEVKSVYSLNRTIAERGMDYALVTLIFANGAVANLEVFWGYPGAFHSSMEISGSQGVIRIDSNKSASLQVRKMASGSASPSSSPVTVLHSPSFNSSSDMELAHFIACIEGGSPPIITARDAYKTLEVALAALESARTGKVVLLQQGSEEEAK